MQVRNIHFQENIPFKRLKIIILNAFFVHLYKEMSMIYLKHKNPKQNYETAEKRNSTRHLLPSKN